MRGWSWLLLLSLLLPGAAQAKWIEASSTHFVVYADESPETVRQFSEQLERFDSALTFVLGIPHSLPSPSNRVTIYVVRNDAEVRRLAGDEGGNMYAFYVPRAGSSFAIVPRVQVKSGQPDFSMIALLHEYTHHVTLSLSAFPPPRWFAEGSAEFFSSASFGRDGSVSLGQPALHRAPELLQGPHVSASDLLDPDEYSGRRQSVASDDAYYGKAWLLYHYLTFSPERRGQASAYLHALQSGQSAKEAALAAFGDFGQLDKELSHYLNARMMMLRVPAERIATGPVTLRTLSDGEAAMMSVRIRSDRGVDREEARAMLPEARAIAARYPNDAAVLTQLAESEYDSGHDDAAITAADAALARDPHQANAYVQKGYALFRRAAGASDKDAAYRIAMTPFQALNRLEPDHPLPLLFYYLSFSRRDATPTSLAVSALDKAAQLAPFDLDLRSMVAFQEIRDNKISDAIQDLQPVAYDPHGGGAAESFRGLLDHLRAGDVPQGLMMRDSFSGQPLAEDMQAASAETARGNDSDGKKAPPSVAVAQNGS